MTERLPFTQASIRRRIEAARKAGLHVSGIAADGTVLTVENPITTVPTVAAQGDNAQPSKWEDVQA